MWLLLRSSSPSRPVSLRTSVRQIITVVHILPRGCIECISSIRSVVRSSPSCLVEVVHRTGRVSHASTHRHCVWDITSGTKSYNYSLLRRYLDSSLHHSILHRLLVYVGPQPNQRQHGPGHHQPSRPAVREWRPTPRR